MTRTADTTYVKLNTPVTRSALESVETDASPHHMLVADDHSLNESFEYALPTPSSAVFEDSFEHASEEVSTVDRQSIDFFVSQKNGVDLDDNQGGELISEASLVQVEKVPLETEKASLPLNWKTLSIATILVLFLFYNLSLKAPRVAEFQNTKPPQQNDGHGSAADRSTESDILTLISDTASTRSRSEAFENLQRDYSSKWTVTRQYREQLVHGQGFSVLHFLASATPTANGVAKPFHLMDEALRRGLVPNAGFSIVVGSYGETLSLTPLALACVEGHTDVMRVLIKHGADINHRISAHVKSIILYAIESTSDGQVTGCLETLLEQGAVVDEETVAIAAIRGKSTYVRTLLHYRSCLGGGAEYKPDLHEALLKSSFPLFRAAMASKTPNLEEGRTYWPAYDESAVEDNVTPLILAAQFRCAECVAQLIEAGVNTAAATSQGNTALHKAFWAGRVSVARILIRHGADMRAENNEGNVPIYGAMYNRKFNMVRWAIDRQHYGVNEGKKDGLTPLMYSAAIGSSDAAEILLQRDADRKIKALYSGSGTIIDAAGIAKVHRHEDIAKLLQPK